MNKRTKRNVKKNKAVDLVNRKITETTIETVCREQLFIKNGKAKFRGIPKRKEHKLYITEYIDHCGYGWKWFTDCDCENN